MKRTNTLILIIFILMGIDFVLLDAYIKSPEDQVNLKENITQIETVEPTVYPTYIPEITPIIVNTPILEGNIKFFYEFGCYDLCGSYDNRPGETKNIFIIKNTGNVNIPKFKLIIEFYRYSGALDNTRSTEKIFEGYEKSIDYILPGTTGYMLISVPSQYSGEETWSYGEIYILLNNKRYHITTWKGQYMKFSDGEQYGMPAKNGTVEIEMK